MKACVLHGVGDLRYEDARDPKPKPDEVLIRVEACGVCGSDIPRIFEKGTYRFPLIPGHEFAGEVVEAGVDADPGLVGKRFAVFPLVPCRQCPMCETGRYAQCSDYDYLGSRCDGAFAEYVTAPVWNLVRVPEGLCTEAAAMAEPAAVAIHAVERAGVAADDSVLAFGAGPIGLLIGMWAKAQGARRILLVDVDPAKVEFAQRLGFPDAHDAGKGDLEAWVKDETGGGADVVIEASGSSPAYEQAMRCARPFGKVVLLGNPAGEMRLTQDGYWAILRKELTVLGSWNSTYGDLPGNEWKLALESMANGTIDVGPLITHRVPLEGLCDALEMMRRKSEFSCKVMVVNGRDALPRVRREVTSERVERSRRNVTLVTQERDPPTKRPRRQLATRSTTKEF